MNSLVNQPLRVTPYQWLIGSPHIRRVYLDELGEAASQSVGLGMVQLVVEDEQTAEAQARELIQKAQQEVEDVEYLGS